MFQSVAFEKKNKKIREKEEEKEKGEKTGRIIN